MPFPAGASSALFGADELVEYLSSVEGGEPPVGLEGGREDGWRSKQPSSPEPLHEGSCFDRHTAEGENDSETGEQTSGHETNLLTRG